MCGTVAHVGIDGSVHTLAANFHQSCIHSHSNGSPAWRVCHRIAGILLVDVDVRHLQLQLSVRGNGKAGHCRAIRLDTKCGNNVGVPCSSEVSEVLQCAHTVIFGGPDLLSKAHAVAAAIRVGEEGLLAAGQPVGIELGIGFLGSES